MGKSLQPMGGFMTYDVLCVGNAIVDLISDVSETFVLDNGFDKGGMMLVDSAESARRLALAPNVAMTPGGSVANTAACLASLGSKVGFVGKVGADPLGAFFRDGMREIGVDFLCEEDHAEIATANCLAVVTPDGERTMSTFLGACVQLSPSDIPEDAIRRAKLVFLEGYLLDSPYSYDAVRRVLEIAAESGTNIALTLSDSSCVERHLERFRELYGHSECNVVIANENEIKALYTTTETDDALDACTKTPKISVVTLGAKGAAVVQGGYSDKIDAEPVTKIVDLVGAGDAFAAGFLHGYVNGVHLRDALTIGAKCSSIIIQGQGARPSVKLADVLYGAEDTEMAVAWANI